MRYEMKPDYSGVDMSNPFVFPVEYSADVRSVSVRAWTSRSVLTPGALFPYRRCCHCWVHSYCQWLA